jgi:hypothetical protein
MGLFAVDVLVLVVRLSMICLTHLLSAKLEGFIVMPAPLGWPSSVVESMYFVG